MLVGTFFDGEQVGEVLALVGGGVVRQVEGELPEFAAGYIGQYSVLSGNNTIGANLDVRLLLSS